MATLLSRSLRTLITPTTFNHRTIKQLSTATPLATAAISHRLFSSSSSTESLATKERLENLVKNNKVVVFMEGVPEAPKCGLSNAVVKILRTHAVPYDSHDVLADESVRQGVKDFTNWPTIPQVFINGEFIGGWDILLQMHESGELVEVLEKVGIKSALLDEESKQPGQGTGDAADGNEKK